MLVALLAVLVSVVTLAVPNLSAFAGTEEQGPSFASTPESGVTGTAIRSSGSGCFLPGTTAPADGASVTLNSSDGQVVVSRTLAVRADGTWQGRLDVPAETAAASYILVARCIHPGFEDADPVSYATRTFAVTGEGPDAGAAERANAPEAGSTIEPFPTYDGQTTCSPSTKPGTAAFRSMLLSAYPGSRDLGISRACNIGGTSEHKEGRAFDWGMNAGDATERAQVTELMTWLTATDSSGNRYANARRLGLMYIIWNRQMLRLYRAEAGWQPYSGPVAHTDHVHFSFTRAGGDKTTSFWRGDYGRPGSGTTPPPTNGYHTTKVTVNGSYDAPVSGDFDGDGRKDIFWYGTGDLADYLWYGTSTGGFTSRQITVRGNYQAPLVGDFDRDGRDDILWYGPAGDADYLWFGRANRSFVGKNIAVSRSYDRPMVGDFNGDGYHDIMWYQVGEGFDYLWQGTQYGFTGRGIEADGEFRAFAGDFDGDHRDDIFWYGPGGALDYLWYGGAGGGFTGKTTSEPHDAQPLVGDFNADGEDDIIWYGPGNLADAMWFGTTTREFTARALTVTGTYQVPLTGDFDGNANADVLWYGRGTAPDYLWRY